MVPDEILGVLGPTKYDLGKRGGGGWWGGGAWEEYEKNESNNIVITYLHR